MTLLRLVFAENENKANSLSKLDLFTSNSIIDLFAHCIPYQATADETGSSNLPGMILRFRILWLTRRKCDRFSPQFRDPDSSAPTTGKNRRSLRRSTNNMLENRQGVVVVPNAQYGTASLSSIQKTSKKY
eukprot:scaffold5028_cov69-Cylindrotheca_fusiformis.AAC.1